MALAGAAAAAHAAGDREAASELLDRAEQLDAEHPSYYGGAWVELTRAMLKPGALGTAASSTSSRRRPSRTTSRSRSRR